MTQPTAPATPRPATTAEAPRTATGLLTQRVLLVARARYLHSIPPHLRAAGFGLGLCGHDADVRLADLAGHGTLLLADPAAYERHVATGEQPCHLPPDAEDMLFGGGIDGVLDDQRTRGAAVAIVPTGHIRADDSDALKAVMRLGQQLQRDDVLLPVSVDVAWLRDGPFGQLSAALVRIPHPKALILGGQYNPTDHHANAPRNLRRLYQDVPNVGLWRTDPVTGFDCLAHDGLFAGIGATTSLRHLVPPGQKPQFGGGAPGPRTPSVFLPELLSFYRADKLDRLYANTAPPPCTCAACHGRLPDRFNGTEPELHQAAEQHNLATWTDILRQLLAHDDPTKRQAWWQQRCQRALRAHTAESDRVAQPGAFTPSKTLQALADLPLAHSAAPAAVSP